MSVPIDVILQLLHERSFCAVPVANSIGNSDDNEVETQQKRCKRRKCDKSSGGKRTKNNRRCDVGLDERKQKRKNETDSLAAKLLMLANALLMKEDEQRAKKEKGNTDEDKESDIDDEETYCDEQTIRNTAINALGIEDNGRPETEEAITKKMEELKQRERDAVRTIRLQHAVDLILSGRDFLISDPDEEVDDPDDDDDDMDQ